MIASSTAVPPAEDCACAGPRAVPPPLPPETRGPALSQGAPNNPLPSHARALTHCDAGSRAADRPLPPLYRALKGGQLPPELGAALPPGAPTLSDPGFFSATEDRAVAVLHAAASTGGEHFTVLEVPRPAVETAALAPSRRAEPLPTRRGMFALPF